MATKALPVAIPETFHSPPAMHNQLKTQGFPEFPLYSPLYQNAPEPI